MAVTADSVVIQLEAKIDGYNAAINSAATNTATAMGRIEQSAAKAETQIVTSARAMANAQRNLGRQIADIGVGISGGLSPFLIIAQQAPQVADALADTGGKAAAVASFFAGPWGAALLAGASTLAVLGSKAFETGETIESLVAKLAENERKAKLAAQADRIFAETQAGLSAQIRKTTAALDAQNASLRTNAQLRNVEAQGEVDAAERGLEKASRNLAQARKRASDVIALSGADESGEAARRARNERTAAEKAVREAQADERDARIALQKSRVYLAAEVARSDVTASGRIVRQYDDRINAAKRELVVAAQSGKIIGKASQDRLIALEKEKAAAVAKAQAEESAQQSTSRHSDAARSGASAQRESAAALREAAAAARELQSEFEAVERKLDPSAVAAQDFRESLDIIQRANLAGLISQADALGLAFRAAAAEAKRITEERDRVTREVLGNPTGEFDKIVDEAERRRRERQDDQEKARYEQNRRQEVAILDLADLYESAFNGGTRSLWDEFKRQGLRTIALLLARWTIAKIGGAGMDGSAQPNGGGLGGIIASVASLFGRASGGYVAPGQTVRVNEGRGGGVELLRMGSQGGTVIPLGQARAPQQSRGLALHQSIHIDASGVNPEGYTGHIVGIVRRETAQAINQNNTAIRKGFPAAQQRFASLGTAR